VKIDMMRNALLRTLCTVSCLMLTACGTVVTAEQPQGPPPDTKAIVQRYLRAEPAPKVPKDAGPGPGSLFSDVQKLGVVELSPPSLVQHPILGWTWLVCLRTHPVGQPTSDYSLFVGADSIRDARLSVATDGCAARTYDVLGQFTAPVKTKDGQQPGRTRRGR
jgi:hypothetical protein